MHTRYIFLFLLFTGCSTPETKLVSSNFFKLKEYFENQAILLNKSGTKLEKTISKDDHSERKIIDAIDWKKELNPFIEADLNKPAWQKSYKADTLVEGNEVHILYNAIESKLHVKKLEVILVADTVYKVIVNIEKKNSYYHATQNLIYNPGKGYSISGSQKVIFATATNYSIVALFNN